MIVSLFSPAKLVMSAGFRMETGGASENHSMPMQLHVDLSAGTICDGSVSIAQQHPRDGRAQSSAAGDRSLTAALSSPVGGWRLAVFHLTRTCLGSFSHPSRSAVLYYSYRGGGKRLTHGGTPKHDRNKQRLLMGRGYLVCAS